MPISLRRACLSLLPAMFVLLPLGASSRGPHSTNAARPFRGQAMLLGAPGENCGAGKDMVVQALELLKADSSRTEIADADEHLKRAIDLCGESGEAWYYRSLVEEKLGHKPQAEFALRKAKMFPSDVLAQGINPFILAAPKGAAPLGPVHDKWALVIGIGSFVDDKLETIPFAASDAQYFRDVLVDRQHGGGFPEDHVRVLTDKAATLRGVKEALNWLARSAQADDLAVVYVASHGSARDADTAGANYILTNDTSSGHDLKLNPATHDLVSRTEAAADELFATALPMIELANDVATRLKARRSAIFLDTCHGGGAALPNDKLAASTKLIAPGVASAPVSARTLDVIRQGAGRIIFAASQTEQKSYDDFKHGHGYFTYALGENLRQHPEMPLSQLFVLVEKQTATGVESDRGLQLSGRVTQTPVMSRSDDAADFALGVASAPALARLGEKGER